MIYGEPINVLHRQELYRFDESTKQNGKHIFNPMSQEEYILGHGQAFISVLQKRKQTGLHLY